jgi:ABC-2 type transport system permease protein
MVWAIFKHNIKSNALIWSLMTGVFLMYFVIILSMYDPEYLASLEELLAMFPEAMIRAMNFDDFGTTLLSFMSGYMYGFLIFLFPMVLSIVVNHRIVAGHVDSGAMAYLLASPNSRTKIIVTQAVFSILANVLLFIVYGLLGLAISEMLFPGQMDILGFMFLNLYTIILYLALGGIIFFFSSIANDKSVSLGFVIGIPVAFLIFQMLSEADESLSLFKYFTLFSLFDPNKIGVDSVFVWGSILVMIVISVVSYGASIIIFNKKNLYV